MHEAFYQLLILCGSHGSVAEELGYTERQYRNIRRKVKHGERLNPRIMSLICLKLQKLCSAGSGQTISERSGIKHERF